jgi:lipoprotein-anchoring transpeptidase ErfK/SrfK
MKSLLSLSCLAAFALLTGCVNGPIGTRSSYDVVAYKPKNPENVRIKVSLSNRAVYVLEGDTPLLVTACAIGKAGYATPTGSYRISGKIPNKRSGEYGFSINGDSIHPAKASEATGHYVGFPMAWWSEFTPGYGFHEGAVWPIPRTHGCIRLHHNVAPKFYALARIGTPVNIAQSQPEDATIGKDLKRPQDYADPDPAPAILVSDRAFSKPPEPLLVDRP